MADVATTGKYTAGDGTFVRINHKSLEAHDEDKHHPPATGDRSHASQIFQVTAVNLAYRETGIRYEQQEPGESGDSGERLWDFSQDPVSEVKDAQGHPVRRPYLDEDQIVQVNNKIVGR